MRFINRSLFGAIILMAFVSTACSRGDSTEIEADLEGIKKYAQESVMKLDTLMKEHDLLVDSLRKSMTGGDEKNLQYDQAKAFTAIERMRAELDRTQKEFDDMPLPKGIQSFPDGVRRYIDRERSFLDEAKSYFSAENNQGNRTAWIRLMDKPQSLSNQVYQLYKQARAASGDGPAASPPAQ